MDGNPRKKFFLHHNSSKYAGKHRLKPTIGSSIIMFPIHINGSHRVALVQQKMNNKSFLFYSDDLNSSNTEEIVKFFILPLILQQNSSHQLPHGSLVHPLPISHILMNVDFMPFWLYCDGG
jgi:hypothetical protein